MSIPVQRYQRNKILGDPTSPELFYLRPIPGQTRSYTISDVAKEAEAISSISAEDMVHATQSFVRSLRKILVRGDKVKIDGLGTFHTTFNCVGTEDEKDCTVKNIRKVNIRFTVDNTLRLVNDSIATTRGADNNIEFYIKSDVAATSGNGGNGNGGNNPDPNPGDGGDDGGFVDPAA